MLVAVQAFPFPSIERLAAGDLACLSPFPSLVPSLTPFQVQHSSWDSVEAGVAAAAAAACQQIDGVVVTEAAGIIVAVEVANAALE